jgi:hypothetical protein
MGAVSGLAGVLEFPPPQPIIISPASNARPTPRVTAGADIQKERIPLESKPQHGGKGDAVEIIPGQALEILIAPELVGRIDIESQAPERQVDTRAQIIEGIAGPVPVEVRSNFPVILMRMSRPF